MTTHNDRTAEDVAHDSLSYLSPRFAEILGPGECDPADRPPTRRDGGTGIIYRPDVLVTLEEFDGEVARYLARKKVPYRAVGRLFNRDGSVRGGDRKPRDRRRPSNTAAEGDQGRDRPDFPELAKVTAFVLEDLPTRERDSLELARLLKAAASDASSPVPPRVVAGPLHLMTLAQRPSIGPGSDPLPATKRDGLPCTQPHREVAPVGVVDTGLWKDALSWGFATGDLEEPQPEPGHVVPWRATGHGGFIAWLINCVAPGAKVDVRNAFTAFDPKLPVAGMTEVSVVEEANDLILQGYRILNLSLGSKVDRALGADLVVFDAAMADWSRIERLLVVAAAGNDASPHPWYPAGYAADKRFGHAVISVGALEGSGGRRLSPIHSRVAKFSNHGPWVTAWAPGVDLVSAYPRDVEFEYTDDLGHVVDIRKFPEGLAKWSGTSFATPLVAALIAAATGAKGDPRKVWADWRQGRPFVVVWPDWWEGEEDPCIPG